MARKPKARTFGTIEPRYNAREWREWKNGGRKTKPHPTGYRARYRLRDPNAPAGVTGELVSAPHSFSTKDAAEAWLDGERRRMDSGDTRTPQQVAADKARDEQAAAVAERLNAVTVNDWAARWITRYEDSAPNTLRQYRSRLNLYVLPAFGERRLVDLTRTDVEDWWATLPAGEVKSSAYRILRTMLNAAVESDDTALKENPCRVRGGGAARPIKGERYLFTPDEVRLVADSIDPRARALVVLLADAGLRISEAIALNVGDVSLDGMRAYVSVEHSMHFARGRGRWRGPTKTKRSRRVALMPATADELRTHIGLYCDPAPDAPLFPTHPGDALPVTRSTAEKWLIAALARAGVIVPEGQYAGWHAFRHYAATRFGQTGASTAAIMRRFGWSRPEMAAHYQRADDDYEVMMLDRMAQAAGSATWESRAASAAGVASLDERRNSKHNNEGEGDHRGAVEA